MANLPNMVSVEVNALSVGVDLDIINASAYWRVNVPQPFNAAGVLDPRPVDGQIWPRGTSEG